MKPFLDDPDFQLYIGDARATLSELPDKSADCIVTSPPYFGLRDYGTGGWEGGDADCDHVRAELRTARANSGGVGNNPRPDLDQAAARKTVQFAGTCGKCGAERIDKQIGLEETPDEYVSQLVSVFHEARRVLADHGTLWLNLGDSYASDSTYSTVNTLHETHAWKQDGPKRPVASAAAVVVKAKNLLGIPWRVALALQADGWYLRSDVIWWKPTVMPESVTDRPTKAHEYLFMFTKKPDYYFDQQAVREPYATTHAPGSKVNATDHYGVENGGNGGLTGQLADVKARLAEARLDPAQPTLDESLPPEAPRGPDGRRQTHVEGREGSLQHRDGDRWPNAGGRNIRTVWQLADETDDAAAWLAKVFAAAMRADDEGLATTVWRVATQPYAGAHFATYPEALVRRCLQASCPERVCRTCGQPSERIVERIPTGWDGSTYGKRAVEANSGAMSGGTDASTLGSGNGRLTADHQTAGWTDCGHDDWRPGRVLDPFTGSGTTAKVARDHRLHAVGIELNPEYAALCAARLQQLSLFGGT